ncbi:transposase IS605 OrfB [Candidatus Thiomargarita nelsonii]|uniref:Transposase IS605 OrfB n=1 Tax=Candidatus Thiomargarita nelsonii TaxID=1003181 RepID=A0A176S7Q4_9GAMM|nr:transposase IS605 OrfB [Candidatus Thiomargarita nelsonii]
MKVTRILKSKNLNRGKYEQLEEQAKRLGQIRSDVWHSFGSINGVSIKSDRKIRDQWLKAKRPFDVSANAWKETLRDAFGDIKANRESAIAQVRKIIYKQVSDENRRHELYKKLKSDEWTCDNYLRRLMRKYWKHSRNQTSNQIIVRSDNYTTFQLGSHAWIKIPSLQKGKRIAIPLNTTVEPTGTLRLILKNGEVEVHYTIDIEETKTCGQATLGIDKGYTEVFVDSNGEHYGEGLGQILSSHSDQLKKKYQARNKLRAIANKKPHKQQKIIENNLGRKKLNRLHYKVQAQIKDTISQATHKLVDKAEFIAAEDLTSPIASKKFGKNVTRRLSAWTKGVIANALDTVSRRRCSSVILVNSAYTSQMDSRHGVLLGKRSGDSFHCFDGVVLQADENAARNVLARLHDPEIDRWMPFQKVKSILLERTERLRLGLLNQDSSCNLKGLSTESELPKMSNFV